MPATHAVAQKAPLTAAEQLTVISLCLRKDKLTVAQVVFIGIALLGGFAIIAMLWGAS